MNKNYVLKTPLEEFNHIDKNNILPLQNIYMGIKLNSYLSSSAVCNRPDLLFAFKMRYTEFYKVCCTEIIKRYDFLDPVLHLLRMLSPTVATSFGKRDENLSIATLDLKLPRLIKEVEIQKIEDQWRTLPLFNVTEDIIKDNDLDQFWTYVRQMESGQFKELSIFCLTVMSLLYSNAQYERVFSKVNRIKTMSRNKLIIEVHLTH